MDRAIDPKSYTRSYIDAAPFQEVVGPRRFPACGRQLFEQVPAPQRVSFLARQRHDSGRARPVRHDRSHGSIGGADQRVPQPPRVTPVSLSTMLIKSSSRNGRISDLTLSA